MFFFFFFFFPRVQNRAYPELHQKVKSRYKAVQLFLKIAWTKRIRIMHLHSLKFSLSVPAQLSVNEIEWKQIFLHTESHTESSEYRQLEFERYVVGLWLNG